MTKLSSNKIISRPSQEKYVYNLHALPSTIEQFHNAADLKVFKKNYKKIRRKHNKWLQTANQNQHKYPPTEYPLTSGELSMIELQKEELQKRPIKKQKIIKVAIVKSDSETESTTDQDEEQ
jgi:hypothetical protein